MQLYELILAEDLVKRRFTKYMGLDINYKEIYQYVKDDLLKFVEGLMHTIEDKDTKQIN
jgi:hypothetical protein